LPGRGVFNLRNATVTTGEAGVPGAVIGLRLTRLLSYKITKKKRAGRLDAVLEDYEPPPWPVSLIYAGEQLLPKNCGILNFATPFKDRLRDDGVGFAWQASAT
jgi:hypothetical protein